MNIYIKGKNYPEKFVYGDISEVIYSEETDNGLFCVNKSGSETEVYWAVQDLTALRLGLERVKNTVPQFTFRYAGEYDVVKAKIKDIELWGYKHLTTHVGYRLDLANLISCAKALPAQFSITLVTLDDLRAVMDLKRTLFPHYQISLEQYQQLLSDINIKIYRLNEEKNLIGFIIFENVDSEDWFI